MSNNDHYHDISDVQHAASEHHRHTARDTGAPDICEFTELGRDVRALEATVRLLEQVNSTQNKQIEELENQVECLADALRKHSQLTSRLARLAERLTGHVIAQQGRF